MNKAAVAGSLSVLLAMVGLPLTVALVVTLTSQAAAKCPEGPTNQAATPAAGPGTVRVAQANLKVSLSGREFRSDLATVASSNPDFVSLNEVSRRSNQQITPPGYRVWRKARNGDDGTAVIWRSDRWEQVRRGRIMMVGHGPQRWDYDRAATWVTLTNDKLGEVSMISVHHMINPAKYGPNKPRRQSLYRQGMEKLKQLIASLSAAGPVFVAGDFNSQWSANDPWGPRAMLRAAGMKTTMDALGKETTHDGGGAIDYLLYQPVVATPARQHTTNLNSDHHLLRADFHLGRRSGQAHTNPKKAGGAQMAPASISTATQTSQASHVQAGLMRLRFTSDYPTLTEEQASNAIAIAQTARELNVPRQGLEIAIAAAIQESKLENLTGGDRDSGGLFQQRPSAGWGTRTQITNPRLATLAFFGRAPHTNNQGLLDLPDWQSLPLTVAAQQVQRSAHPDLYAQWEPVAKDIADLLGGDLPGNTTGASEDCEPPGASTDCQPIDTGAEKGLTPDARLVLRKINARFGPHTYGGVGERSNNPTSDHPAGRAVDVMIDDWETKKGIAHGTRIAEWVRQHARELGITYVIWRARIWSTGDRGWRSYSHPSGGSDPTLQHMDHVHISVHGEEATSDCTTGSGKTVYPVPADYTGTDRHNWHSSGSSWSSWHSGTDFSAPCGTPVYAAHAGTVEIDTTQDWAGPRLVKITTGADSVSTWYAHMQEVTVSRGESIRPGQRIGMVGDEGNSRGCHLHFEVHERNGSIYGPDNVNPSDWLAENAGPAKS
ncbi:MAG: peptidoglycan DD-metalloendopeptidase family protein [Brachybacterium sp.]|nr:peptidoglycan DD-metalloendopeptidase family protein [Brachybacterium sp.]